MTKSEAVALMEKDEKLRMTFGQSNNRYRVVNGKLQVESSFDWVDAMIPWVTRDSATDWRSIK